MKKVSTFIGDVCVSVSVCVSLHTFTTISKQMTPFKCILAKVVYGVYKKVTTFWTHVFFFCYDYVKANCSSLNLFLDLIAVFVKIFCFHQRLAILFSMGTGKV